MYLRSALSFYIYVESRLESFIVHRNLYFPLSSFVELL